VEFRWFSMRPHSVLWAGPGLLGLVLILLGLAILAWPELLQMLVALVFVLAGLGLLGFAWNARRSVRYRRMDDVMREDDFRGPLG
jgi:Flp pilus assembly protein TadB